MSFPEQPSQVTKSEGEYKTMGVPPEIRCELCRFYHPVSTDEGVSDKIIGIISKRATCLHFEKAATPNMI